MHRRKKYAVAATAALIPLGLWGGPAAAAEETYDYDQPLFFNTADGFTECNLYSEATWDSEFGDLVVNARERLDRETCAGSLKISVQYDDASGVRRTLSTETISDELDLAAAGIVGSPVVTVTREYFVCLQHADNTSCTTEFQYDAHTPK